MLQALVPKKNAKGTRWITRRVFEIKVINRYFNYLLIREKLTCALTTHVNDSKIERKRKNLPSGNKTIN
jgi:hypothetical protein